MTSVRRSWVSSSAAFANVARTIGAIWLTPAIHGVVRWRRIALMQWVWEEFGISLSEATMSREMKALGYRKISARPRHHAQNEFVIEAFKSLSPA